MVLLLLVWLWRFSGRHPGPNPELAPSAGPPFRVDDGDA
jgi:hypothetical protein